MTISEATAEDVGAIRRVASASWERDYPDILSRETVESGFDDWYGHERLKTAISDPLTLVLVAKEGDDVVGFVHAIVDGPRGVLLRLYVHPDHRREGVGSQLFEHARDGLLAYDVDRIRSMVLANNRLGNDFYRQLGFEKVTAGETIIAGERFSENTYELQ